MSLTKSGNKLVILIVVDQLSKYDHLCAPKHHFKAFMVTQVLMDNIFKLHGMLQYIVIYHDPTFNTTFLQDLFYLQGIQLNLSTTYHPRLMVRLKLSTST
jgi:hypothetical protein